MNLMKQIPNAISVFRICFSPFIIIFAKRNEWLLAFIMLAATLLSDALDGWLAIKLNAKSKIGKYLDNIGDLVMVICALAGVYLTGVLGLSYLLAISIPGIIFWLTVQLVPPTYFIRDIFNILLRLHYIGVGAGLVIIYNFMALGKNGWYVIFGSIPFIAYLVYVKWHRINSLQAFRE